MEVDLKYAGYLKKQEAQIQQMRRLESALIPPETDYRAIEGLRLEAREKLDRVRPLNLGQASRISGVNPADISVLVIYLEQQRRQASGQCPEPPRAGQGPEPFRAEIL